MRGPRCSNGLVINSFLSFILKRLRLLSENRKKSKSRRKNSQIDFNLKKYLYNTESVFNRDYTGQEFLRLRL